jgi:hypothetical protein
VCVAIFSLLAYLAEQTKDGAGRGDESFDVETTTIGLPQPRGPREGPPTRSLPRGKSAAPVDDLFLGEICCYQFPPLFIAHRIVVTPDARGDGFRPFLPAFFAGSMPPGPPRLNGRLSPAGANSSALPLKAKMSSSPSERVATVDRPMPGMTLCGTVVHTNRHTAGGNPN